MNKNLRTGLILGGIVLGLLVLAFAAKAAGLSQYANGFNMWQNGNNRGSMMGSGNYWSMMGGQNGSSYGSMMAGRSGAYGSMMSSGNCNASGSMMNGQYGGMMGSQNGGMMGGQNGHMDFDDMPHHNGTGTGSQSCPLQNQQP